MGTELRITRCRAPRGVCRLVLAGQVDMDTAEHLARALDEVLADGGAPEVLAVDCSGLEFCGSAGLNELLRARRAALAAGVAFRLAAPSPQVTRLLQVTEADTVFDVEDADVSRLEGTAC
ncbi:STAS domain-containing protein [Kitasatospora sp. NPDC051914]|uniref:STAS domain-containing protein n=1 Tax=Kitasatospora sp. NPDC051914 TaxID=3154945 RepID=UPI00341A37C7